MKTYRQHRCSAQHRTYNKFMQCAVRRVEWVLGEGPVALIAWCRVPTVSLYETVEEAEEQKAFIDRTACGGMCNGRHEIVRVEK